MSGSNLPAGQQLTQLGAEQFNVPAILRMLDAEAKAAYGGSERTQIELVARLVRAQQAEAERMERALAETHDAWTAETTKRLQSVHERDCAVEDVARIVTDLARAQASLALRNNEVAQLRETLRIYGITPAGVGPAAVGLGYCNGVGADGVPCFVRAHCMHHTHPDAMTRTIDPPFRWWLSDHNRWAMECSEYVEDKLAPSRADKLRAALADTGVKVTALGPCPKCKAVDAAECLCHPDEQWEASAADVEAPRAPHEHVWELDGSHGGAKCACGKHADQWYCETSPDHLCKYSKSFDSCDYCGDPEERK
jgi:hypothetical protein